MNILTLSPDKRARLGMFLAFQYPTAIPGLSVASFLRTALNARRQGLETNPDVDPSDPVRGGISMGDFRRLMRAKMGLLKMDESFAARYVNEGFSGGEKKRLEMLQMAVLEPEIAILDETDSGLDIDALRVVAEGVNDAQPSLPCHVLARAGSSSQSGGSELALSWKSTRADTAPPADESDATPPRPRAEAGWPRHGGMA